MRIVTAGIMIVAGVLIGVGVGALAAQAPWLNPPPGITKPVRSPTPAPASADSCRWANDNECDEPDIGTGACQLNTDVADCRRLRDGEDDSCRWARDGECDEPNLGTGACVQGTDRTDCGDIAWLRNLTDACATAFNGVCEEPGRGNGLCQARTDRSDCHGRARPMTISDHFFGRDDRVLVPVREAPWSYMGELVMDNSARCTATLVAANVIVSAAHCIHAENRISPAGRFVSVSGAESRVIAYLVDPRFNSRRFDTTDEIDGTDWTLLRLADPLGDRIGHAGVRNLTGEGAAAARAAHLMQAGFAWDTGRHLSGNLRCRIVEVNDDNTFEHQCDTTRGDSGSSFLVRNGAGFDVIGVDSNYRSVPHAPPINIAVSAAAFAPYVADVAAGRRGVAIGRLAKRH